MGFEEIDRHMAQRHREADRRGKINTSCYYDPEKQEYMQAMGVYAEDFMAKMFGRERSNKEAHGYADLYDLKIGNCTLDFKWTDNPKHNLIARKKRADDHPCDVYVLVNGQYPSDLEPVGWCTDDELKYRPAKALKKGAEPSYRRFRKELHSRVSLFALMDRSKSQVQDARREWLDWVQKQKPAMPHFFEDGRCILGLVRPSQDTLYELMGPRFPVPVWIPPLIEPVGDTPER